MKFRTPFHYLPAAVAVIAMFGAYSARAEEPNVTIHVILEEELQDSVRNLTLVPTSNTLEKQTFAVEEDKVTIQCHVLAPEFVWLSTGPMGSRSLILEPGEFDAVLYAGRIHIEGSSLQSTVFGYEANPEYRELDNERMRLIQEKKERGSAETAEEAKAIQQEFMAIMQDRATISNAYLKPIIEGEHAAVTKYYALQFYSGDDIDRELLNAKLGEELADNPVYLAREERARQALERQELALAQAAKYGVGATFADVDAVDADGNVVKLSEIIAKNEYTLLDFWASWCGPCRAEFPHLKRAYAAYRERGFEIYALSVDADHDAWLDALDEEDTSWVNVLDNAEGGSKSLETYGVIGIPHNLLIDSEGKIVAKEVRGSSLDETLERMFGSDEDS